MRRLLQAAGKPDVPGLFIARHCEYFWATVPYLGLGYNDRPLRSGWGFTADVGVMALRPSGGLRLDRGGVPTVDDVQRDLRLAPVLQLGASYAF